MNAGRANGHGVPSDSPTDVIPGTADQSGPTGRQGSGANVSSNERPPRQFQAAHVQRNRSTSRSDRTATTALVQMALERYDLGHSPDGEAFAVPKREPRIVSTLRAGKTPLRSDLARRYFAEHGSAVGQQQVTDALMTLEGLAQAAEPRRLWLRVAQHEGAHYLDLGDSSGHAIRIADGGWSVGPPPVLFRRTSLTGALPIPERGGSLQGMWDSVNVTTADQPLVLAYLVAALEPDIPHPVLGVFGEQGSGKSSTVRTLVSYLDPSPVPVRKPPRDAEAWIVGAGASWIVALDNVRTVPDWFSDLLCRAVTGEGEVRRRLYTDADLQTFAFRRVVIVNGIDVGNLSDDLADRLLPITLERFDDADRRGEAELRAGFERGHAQVLGAILDVAAGVLAHAPAVELRQQPRMLDFARVVAAVDKQLGTDGLTRYLATRTRLAAEAIASDPLLIRLTGAISEPYMGTATELLALLQERGAERRHGSLPSSARSMTQALRRMAPTLRKTGWQVQDDDGRNKQSILRWTLVPPKEIGDTDPPDPPDRPELLSPASRADGNGGGGVDADHIGLGMESMVPSGQDGRPQARRFDVAGPAGQAGQERAVSPDALLARAQEYLAGLPRGDRHALEARCAKALAEVPDHPHWWRVTARTEAEAVTVALALIAADRREGRPIAAANAYLSAAREASRLSASVRSQRQPPP